jgi:hypothetical protein
LRGSRAIADLGLSGAVYDNRPFEAIPHYHIIIANFDYLLGNIVLHIFRDSLPSTVFSTTTSRDMTFSSAVIVRFSPMTTFLPWATSACSGQISTLEFCKSMVSTGKGFLSTCISLRLNRPLLMADWTCRWKIL